MEMRGIGGKKPSDRRKTPTSFLPKEDWLAPL
jgi:hypothetical protein